MIVAQRKPLAEIKDLLGQVDRVLVLGCGTCAAVCLAGGEKEAGVLASQLRLSYGLEGRKVRAEQITLERQCDREFLDQLKRKIGAFDAVVSLACGAGVQFLSEMYPGRMVLPGVDTIFIGVTEEAGLWTERCRACGQCVLGLTAGVCPTTMCPKGLQNGPCGGTMDGQCEADQERSCSWVRIYERLEAAGRLDLLTPPRPPLNHARFRRPGRLVHPAYKRRFAVGDQD